MFTENGIKMCEKAEEIQKLWIPKCGDWVTCDNPKDGRIVIITSADQDAKKDEFLDMVFPYSYGGNRDYKRKDKMIWLPTQEQLFKIHADWFLKEYKGKMKISEYLLRLCEFTEIAEEPDYKYYSLKEMMLGYLYQEKYSKEWTGEKWELIE